MKAYQQRLLLATYRLAVDTPYCFRAKIAAALYSGRTAISFGFNQTKTHPLQSQYAKHPQACYIHAEMDAIVKALRSHSAEDLKNFDLYVARAKRARPKGEYVPALAKPCPGCQKAIAAFGIRRVFYTEGE